MSDASGFFRGTSSDQDTRFSDKEKKLMKQMKFQGNVEKKVSVCGPFGVVSVWMNQPIFVEA